MYDVIIVGSGPAGATAAYRLGQAGCRVVVVEKQKLPRYKPCGGGLSLDFLEQQFPFSFSPAIDMHVHKVYYQFLGLEINLPVRDRAMAMVMRDRFDQHILAQASCEVREGTGVRQVWQEPDRVVVEADNGEKISGRYLIGADGANSVVAHALGARRKRSIPAIEIEALVPDSVYRRYAGGPYFIFDGQPRYGYLWVFPKTSCLSVGIAGLHPKRGQLQAELQKVMAGLG
ncbi:MAG TPA: FAD-dependent oxidoreductase, partial [Anaerolineaceae bacterium]